MYQMYQPRHMQMPVYQNVDHSDFYFDIAKDFIEDEDGELLKCKAKKRLIFYQSFFLFLKKI